MSHTLSPVIHQVAWQLLYQSVAFQDVVYNLQGAVSCHDGFKPSSIYEWLPPHTIGSYLLKCTPNSPN